MFSNFYWWDLHNIGHVALANMQWNNCKNRIDNELFVDLVMVIESAGVLTSKVDT